MIRILALISLLSGTAAWAELDLSLRPVARVKVENHEENPVKLPGKLPEKVPEKLPEEEDAQMLASAQTGIAQSLRPALRPADIGWQLKSKRKARKKGRVCGSSDIEGEAIGSIPGKLRGCGVQSAVRIHRVAGVKLSQNAIMDCTTAKALKKWIEKGAKPAVGRKGGGLSGLRVAAHYACRTRNNKPGGKISEHGKGHAIDISGFILKNGSSISVLKGWKSKDRRILRRAHKAACGPFGTVLGPESDRYHQDHFHFDTARYRSGPYCR